MNKLEQACKDLDAKYPSTRKLTIKERDEYIAKLIFDKVKIEIAEEQARHQYEMMRLNRMMDNATTLRKIISGTPGFLRCSQGQLEAISGFTTIGDVLDYVGKQFVDLSLEQMRCSFGMEVWAIDDRGMMTLVDAKRDSSD